MLYGRISVLIHSKCNSFLPKYLFAIVIAMLSFLRITSPIVLIHDAHPDICYIIIFILNHQSSAFTGCQPCTERREETSCGTLSQAIDNPRERTNIQSEKKKVKTFNWKNSKRKHRSCPLQSQLHSTVHIWESWSEWNRVVITQGGLPGPAEGGRKGGRDGKKPFEVGNVSGVNAQRQVRTSLIQRKAVSICACVHVLCVCVCNLYMEYNCTTRKGWWGR